MATKDISLPYKNKLNFAINASTDQNNHLNLNQKQKYSVDAFSKVSKIATFKKGEVLNNALTKALDFANKNEAKKDSHSWKKLTKVFPSNFGNDGSGKYDGFKKGENTKATNNSTLSLHIEAYENSVENGTSDFLFDGKSESLKRNAKQILTDLPSLNQNSFEFPRQQGNGETKMPEVSQFKASQRLLNPNPSTKFSATSRIVSNSTDLSQQQQEPKFHDIENVPQATPSSPSNSLNTNTGGKNRKNGDEFGEQIVELISRLINEADPETEKINVEFTITPFQINNADASKEASILNTSGSIISSESTESAVERPGDRRLHPSRKSISSSNNDSDLSSASNSQHKSGSRKSDSDKLDELSYAYYQSLVQQRIQRPYLEEMPSKPRSSKEAMKKSKKRRPSKKNKKQRRRTSSTTDSSLSEVKTGSGNKGVKSSKKSSSEKNRHRSNQPREGSPDGERNANWYINE